MPDTLARPVALHLRSEHRHVVHEGRVRGGKGKKLALSFAAHLEVDPAHGPYSTTVPPTGTHSPAITSMLP